MAAAGGLDVAALVLVSYPLHPPGRPERLRTAHFPDLRLPCLFVSGRRDAFAAPEELERETAAIPGAVTRRSSSRGTTPCARASQRSPAPLLPGWPSSPECGCPGTMGRLGVSGETRVCRKERQ